MDNVKKKLLVKQVIGRLLLDTDHGPYPFVLQEQDGEWRIAIEQVASEQAEEISRLSQDLNLFYFEEHPDGIRKWWLYGKERPLRLSYDAQGQTLELIVDSRVGYSNEKV